MLLSPSLHFYSANPSPTSIAAPKPPAVTTKSAAAPSEVFEAAPPDPVAVPEEESPEEEEEEVVVEVEEDDAATAPELPVVSVAPVPDAVLPIVLDAWVLVAALVVVVSYSVAALQ